MGAGDWDGSGKSVEDTRTHMDEDFMDDSAFKGKPTQVLANPKLP